MFEKWKYPWNKRKDNDDRGAEEEVYAGPEFFEENQRPMGRVYAGPEFYNKQPRPMECVYAGPEYFAGEKPDAGMMIEKADEVRRNREMPVAAPMAYPGGLCSVCGVKNEAGNRFCNNCGAPLPQEEG